MQRILKALRYLIFGIFIICNAIVASIAVWNHSLAQSDGWSARVDIYLIFLGCFGLALIFAIIFTELGWEDSVTGQVWFECVWVGLFSLLYLAAAVVVSAISPGRMCNLQSIRLLMMDGLCTSSRVILAFTWTSYIILFGYLSLLVIASLIHLKHDSRIWHRYVYKFPWADFRRPLSSTPPSPSLPRFLKKMPTIAAPRPQRMAPAALYNYRSGLSPEYEIEHYHPPSHPSTQPPNHILDLPTPPIPAAVRVPVLPSSQNIPQEITDFSVYAPAFYPHYMQSNFLPPVQSYEHQRPQRPLSPPSPPPLGDWPRLDAVMQPLRSKRNKITGAPPGPETSSAGAALRPRPSGPRRKSRGDRSIPAPEFSVNVNAPTTSS